MPKQFHPRQRGVHRIACIALYRALLSKCAKIEVPPDLKRFGRKRKVHPVAAIIQQQFRRNRKYESETLVRAAMRIGYEAEELLHNAVNGDEQAESRILSLVSAWHEQSAQSLLNNALSPPPLHPQQLHIKPEAILNAPKLLETRPRPLHSSAINRVRSIPKLVSANGVPFLRYHKKQSPFLTRVINDKRMIRTKRHETMNLMHAQGEMGSISWAEEVWDGLVESSLSTFSPECSGLGSSGEQRGKSRMENRGKKNDKRDGMGTWRESFLLSERHQSTMLNVEKARNRRYALKMTQILEEEQRLHDIEKEVVAKEKRNARTKAKRLRKTEEERKKRREFLDGLAPKEREREVERFRKELAQRKMEGERVKAKKLGSAKRYGKEELDEIAGSGWEAPSAAPSEAPTPSAPYPPRAPFEWRSAAKTSEQHRKMDDKRSGISDKSKTMRERTKGLAAKEKKARVAEAGLEKGAFTISWGRGRPDR